MTSFLKRKFQPNLKTLRESREKHLDNVSRLLYNIRTGYRKRGIEMNVNKMAFSTNPAVTEEQDNILREQFDILSEIADKAGTRAVIAGGAVRDTLLGLPYRDLDFFILDSNDDDTLVYMTELYREKKPEFDRAARPIAQGYANSLFTGYEFTALQRNPLGEVPPGLRPIQFIGRNETTAEELVSAFDYDLVRCWYDGQYHIDNSFEMALKAKRVPTESFRTYDRVQAWKNRTGFKITVGRPPKKAPEPIPGLEVKWIARNYDANPVVMNRLELVPPRF